MIRLVAVIKIGTTNKRCIQARLLQYISNMSVSLRRSARVASLHQQIPLVSPNPPIIESQEHQPAPTVLEHSNEIPEVQQESSYASHIQEPICATNDQENENIANDENAGNNESNIFTGMTI